MNRPQRGLRRLSFSGILVLSLALQGCGLVLDAVQYIKPVAADELDGICGRGRLQVGMAFEPFRPFVFPAIFTSEGPRVTGLDVELVREITAALSERCGRPITPVLHLVHFRDLFIGMSEGKLDLFVSAVSINIPSPAEAGLAFSIPYFYDGGLALIVKRPEVAARIAQFLRDNQGNPNTQALKKAALAGMGLAVHEGRSPHLYAKANLQDVRLLLCDSFPAAFESQDPGIDAILGKQPIMEFMATRVHQDWQPLKMDDGKPFLLTREHYAVVLADESYRLRWFVNEVLFQLETSGRLADMRHRWLKEDYVYARRAATEGLPFAAEKMGEQSDQGRCRWAQPS